MHPVVKILQIIFLQEIIQPRAMRSLSLPNQTIDFLLVHSSDSAPQDGFAVKRPSVDDEEFALFQLGKGSRYIHDFYIEFVYLLIRKIRVHRSNYPIIPFVLFLFDHPNWAGAFPHQVHGSAAEKHTLQPALSLSGLDYQVVVFSQHLTDDLKKWFSEQQLCSNVQPLLPHRFNGTFKILLPLFDDKLLEFSK